MLHYGGIFDDDCAESMARAVQRKSKKLDPAKAAKLLDDVLLVMGLVDQHASIGKDRPVYATIDLDHMIYDLDPGSSSLKIGQGARMIDMLDDALPGFAIRLDAQRSSTALEASTPSLSRASAPRQRL
jgi:hypothetical protein